MKPQQKTAWAVKMASNNKMDGSREWLAGCAYLGRPSYLTGVGAALFATRREAREWMREHHGYIAKRPDLRAEPFGWKPAKVVRVSITVREAKGA